MRSSRSLLGFTLAALALLLLAAPASAITYQGTVQFTCTDFTAAGTGAAILDRDNTGTGDEQARLDVRDGNGVLIYTLTFSNPLGTYAPGLIDTTAYTTPPTANPITLTITSLAGNGLPQVVLPVYVGGCSTLANPIPTVGLGGMIAMGGLIAAAAVLLLARR